MNWMNKAYLDENRMSFKNIQFITAILFRMEYALNGVDAAWKVANVEPGSTVVIFGLRSIGLAVAEGARPCGATKIIGVDINSDKLEIGKQFGITDFVNSKSCGDKPDR